jgi:hypothetical protein
MILKSLSIEATLACYPDDDVAEQIERSIELSLRPIASLTAEITAEQRLKVFQMEAAKARAAFCAIYGDPFGADKLEAALPKRRGIVQLEESIFLPLAAVGV